MNAQWFNATPLLPHEAVQYLAVHLGWGLVLASALVYGARRFDQASRSVVAVLFALALVWCFVPGPASLSYWLGLAFQAPSLVTDSLCIWYLQTVWRGQPVSPVTAPSLRALGAAAALLGWLLLLDMVALLPWQIYALGLSPAVTAAVLFIALLPWMWSGRFAIADARSWIAPFASGIFLALRWPSGNVWDAVIDPWLWVWLNVFVIRGFWNHKTPRAS